MLQVPDVIVEANWLHENLENSRLITSFTEVAALVTLTTNPVPVAS